MSPHVTLSADAYAPGPPLGTYGLRVPASRVVYVPEAQGGLPPGPHVQYVLGTRTSLGRWVRTAYCGTPGRDLEPTGGGSGKGKGKGRRLAQRKVAKKGAESDEWYGMVRISTSQAPPLAPARPARRADAPAPRRPFV